MFLTTKAIIVRWCITHTYVQSTSADNSGRCVLPCIYHSVRLGDVSLHRACCYMTDNVFHTDGIVQRLWFSGVIWKNFICLFLIIVPGMRGPIPIRICFSASEAKLEFVLETTPTHICEFRSELQGEIRFKCQTQFTNILLTRVFTCKIGLFHRKMCSTFDLFRASKAEVRFLLE